MVKTKIHDLRTRAGEYDNENDVGETVLYYNTRVIIVIIEVPTRRLWWLRLTGVHWNRVTLWPLLIAVVADANNNNNDNNILATLHAAAVIFDFIVFAHNMFFISKWFFHFMIIASLISTYYYNDVYLHISRTDHRQNNITLVKCIILLSSWHDRALRVSLKRSEGI